MPFTDELGTWIARQRWYAGKGRKPRFRVLDAQAASGATRYLVMDDAGAPPVLYQVPVARVAVPGGPSGVIGRDGDDWLVDATGQPPFATSLLAEMGVDADAVTGARVLAGEQSNTSIVLDVRERPAIILKLFRALHHGENPDVTVQRALSEAGSPFVPRFLGSLEATWPDVGRESGSARGTLAFAQEFLPGARDGWSLALEAAAEERAFTTAARELGVAVATVHGALGAALGTIEAGPEHVAAAGEAWRRRLATAAEEVPALGDRVRAIDAVYRAALERPWPPLQRIHGDLHLGQVLAVPEAGWRIIDFEGEPLRPMEERAVADLAPRDVAGMLRSFQYAGAVGGGATSGSGSEAWAATCGQAFVEAYADAPGSVELDPVLLRALVLDKAVYEATYEARNRPDWLPVPLAGIDAALG